MEMQGIVAIIRNRDDYNCFFFSLQIVVINKKRDDYNCFFKLQPSSRIETIIIVFFSVFKL